MTALRIRAVGQGVRDVAVGPWGFPLLVVLVLLVLTAFSISGTSSGALHDYLYGGIPDPHVLLGRTRSIRSDEWLVNTPMVIAQVAAGYPHVNGAIGGGQDMSVVFDVPYLEWSSLFRPQDWMFGLLPLGPAFAWKWWSLAALLVGSVYALGVQLVPRARLFVALVAAGVLLSPFVQWWFISTTLASLAWAFAAAAAFVWLLGAATNREVVLRSVLLWFSCTCFALVLYPAFQVPCALVTAALCIGLLVTRAQEQGRRAIVRPLLAALAAVSAAGAVLGVFLLTRADVVRAIADTDYPGRRVVEPGGFSLVRFMSGLFEIHLQRSSTPGADGFAETLGNQSEASAFILAGLFLVAVDVHLIVRARRLREPINGALVGLLIVLVVFLAHLFLSSWGLLSHALLLTLVPQVRLQIGLGMLSAALVLVTAGEMARQRVRPPLAVVVPGALVAMVLAVEAGARLHRASPAVSGSRLFVTAAAVLLALVVLLLARGHLVAGAGLLLAMSAASSVAVNPVYRGVLDVRSTPVGAAMRAVEQRDPGAWVSLAGIVGNAVMVESGVPTYSAVLSYPRREVWRDLDPDGHLMPVYNRYAHVVFQRELAGEPLQNPQPDVILARFDPCGLFAQKRVRHVLAESPVAGDCLRETQSVPMPGRTFVLYDVVPPS